MPRFAMLFPGQGAQSVGMLADLAAAHPSIAETYAEASEALGYDIGALINDGPAHTLDQTEYTQPALLTVSVALWRAWSAAGGPEPAFMAGHSLGEYSALTAAGALDFSDALRLTRLRGQAMQAAVAPGAGAMAAVIGLNDDAVRAACERAAAEHAEASRVVSAANYNAPLQVVIAGDTEAVATAGRLAKEAGAKMVRDLPVSVPSHCALMRPAAERLRDYLADTPMAEPCVPVVHNVDARPRDSAEDIRAALVRQLDHSVLWADTIRYIQQSGDLLFLECGPGKVLSGLNKRIDKRIRSVALSEPQALDMAIAETRA